MYSSRCAGIADWIFIFIWWDSRDFSRNECCEARKMRILRLWRSEELQSKIQGFRWFWACFSSFSVRIGRSELSERPAKSVMPPPLQVLRAVSRLTVHRAFAILPGADERRVRDYVESESSFSSESEIFLLIMMYFVSEFQSLVLFLLHIGRKNVLGKWNLR